MNEAPSRTVSELNAAILEYLKINNLTDTQNAFEKELINKDQPIRTDLTPCLKKENDENVKELLTQHYENGDGESFFQLWNTNIPDHILKLSSDCQKIEFNLHIFFAVFPLLHGRPGSSKGFSASMTGLKHYFETKGASLSQTPEFVMFYALPYVANPMEHPTFKILFEDKWQAELRDDLYRILEDTFQKEKTSYLYQLHSSYTSNKEKDILEQSAQLQEMQAQLREFEFRTTVYFRKYGRLQADYHVLIGIAAELVDALENTVRGEMITPDYLQNICERLISNNKTQPSDNPIVSYDLSRPGTAASVVRSSLLGNIPKVEDSSTAPPLPSLNFDKVKRDLIQLQDHERALLLQALRWRLTRSMPGEQRDGVIAAFIANDILGCAFDASYKEELIQMMRTSRKVSCEQFARFFNALASFSAGRAYIAHSNDMVAVLLAITKEDTITSSSSEHFLGALQKLSLRRSSQTIMISQSVIPWLIECLSSSESLSDYSIEYVVALLMNLCLRSSGKMQCRTNPRKIIKLLTDLLAYNNQDIRPYVNGTLYSILALPTIRKEAIQMGLEEILNGFIDKDQPDLNRQIQFIIKQLNIDVSSGTDDPVSDNENEEEDDDNDEEGDAVDVELDKETSLALRPNELHGEKLLCKHYLGILSSLAASTHSERNGTNSRKADNSLFRRPVTPASSRLGKSRSVPFNANEDHDSMRPLSSSSLHSYRSEVHNGSKGRQVNTRQPQGPMPELSRTGPVGSKTSGSAFVARPKIPRTPDPDAFPGRPRTSEPPLPTRSLSPTRR